MKHTTQLIDKLSQNRALEKHEYVALIQNRDSDTDHYLFARSSATAIAHYGKNVYFRGLIEVSNYCARDCYYCGIRRSNRNVERYRLTHAQILDCCANGYALGFRTFVLQGGEDPHFTDERLCDLLCEIKRTYPDCAVTLSLGERSRASYQALFEAGADRYLLRHETATPEHYGKLHPAESTLQNRIRCLHELKEIGYQVGCGFMVGSPFQTALHLAEDLLFLQDFRPHMVGIGPFIPHHDTPFAHESTGTLDRTLFMLGLARLILPNALIPATTALGSIAADGRERGILVGANVVMPNLSPSNVRAKYALYDNKVSMGAEASEGLALLRERVERVGYTLAVGRGDYKHA